MRPSRLVLIALAALALLAGLATSASAASSPSTGLRTSWAPADSATVHPGVQTDTQGAQCTANFVFQDASGVYIGQAAHCAGDEGDPTATNGCDASSLPLGTKVNVDGAAQPGTLVYSSWLAMQSNGEDDVETCEYNDFALIRLEPTDVSRVNPSVPYFGGPLAVGDATDELEDVYTYGNSSLRLGLTVLSPKSGYSLGTTPEGWSHTVYTVTPGIPGDSGSAFLDSKGDAIGTLSTVAIAPLAGSNGVSDLAHQLAYARANGFPDLQLVPGTEPFQPGLGLLGL